MAERFIIIGRSTCPFCNQAVDFAKQTKENIFFLTTMRKEKYLKTISNFTDKKLSRLFLQIISKQDILTLLVDIPTC